MQQTEMVDGGEEREAVEEYCPVCWEAHPRAICGELTRGLG